LRDTKDISRQEIDYLDYDPANLPSVLDLKKPPFVENAFGQLEYIAQYVTHKDLDCKSIAIERRHIDRDYMEDHSVFYSRSLQSYANYCQRVHFFAIPVAKLEEALSNLVAAGRNEGAEKFGKKCEAFSNEYYLGFCVIKPLRGCPVGRTVLRPLGPDAIDGRRHFQCTRLYTAHLAGIPLTVRGLAFQQQDAGVSACATTALWSAMQKIRESEELGNSSPARITTLAAQYNLPFGRSMPSEGLSIGQLCTAVQALGVSPNMFSVEDFDLARDLIFAATDSGIASVLIIQEEGDVNYHAVTVTGMKLIEPRKGAELTPGLSTIAGDLLALYIHDDRVGPYVRADIVERTVKTDNGGNDQQRVGLKVKYESNDETKIEIWILSHILVPMHGKVRLSFADLRLLASLIIVPTLHVFHNTELPNGDSRPPLITFGSKICLAHQYLVELLFTPNALSPEQFDTLRSKILLSRYVGVVRLEAPFMDSIDVVFDTTSTLKNLNCLGIVPLGKGSVTLQAATFLAEQFECPVVES